MSKTRESTFKNQYEKYLATYEKIAKEKELTDYSHAYSYQAFKDQFELQELKYQQEGVNYNKYNIYKDLAKSHQKYTDKQLRYYSRAIQQERTKLKAKVKTGQALTSEEQDLVFLLKNNDLWDGNFAQYRTAPIMSQLVLFYEAGYDFYSNIDS